MESAAEAMARSTAQSNAPIEHEEFQIKLNAAYQWMSSLPVEHLQHILTLQQSTLNALDTQRQKIREQLGKCEDRLFAVLHRDDGQDYKEGRRYLKQYCPDLYRRLELDTPFDGPPYTLREEENVVTILAEAVCLARNTFSHYGDLHAAKPYDHKDPNNPQLKATANYQLAAKMEAALKHAVK